MNSARHSVWDQHKVWECENNERKACDQSWEAALLLLVGQGVPAWPEHQRSCGYSPPGFFPVPPASIFLPPRWVTQCHVSAWTAYCHKARVHTYVWLFIVTCRNTFATSKRTHTHVRTHLNPPQKSFFNLSHMSTLALSAVTLNSKWGAENKETEQGSKPAKFGPSLYYWQYFLEKWKAKPHLGHSLYYCDRH